MPELKKISGSYKTLKCYGLCHCHYPLFCNPGSEYPFFYILNPNCQVFNPGGITLVCRISLQALSGQALLPTQVSK